jgi:hypothetical protein
MVIISKSGWLVRGSTAVPATIDWGAMMTVEPPQWDGGAMADVGLIAVP